MPTPPGQIVYRLRITLVDVVPTVWRRVLVPGGVRLGKLHDIFQVTMGWTDSHLHSFTIGGRLYGTNFDEYPDEEIDEKTVTVRAAIGNERRFAYEYDFGDSWDHEVVVEDEIANARRLKFAICLDGQNACPPEDCGGTPGYEELLDALADPTHEEHENFLRWVGGSFDPSEFDLVAVNIGLQHLR